MADGASVAARARGRDVAQFAEPWPENLTFATVAAGVQEYFRSCIRCPLGGRKGYSFRETFVACVQVMGQHGWVLSELGVSADHYDIFSLAFVPTRRD